MIKKVAILGGKESGVGAAVLAKKQGYDVFVSDYGTIGSKHVDVLRSHNIDWEENQHTTDRIIHADEIVISPGIPGSAPIVQAIHQSGKTPISEIEFAYRYTDACIVAITGSNGKTTTTSLTYNMLKNAGLNVGLAGNIGQSFAMQVATCQYDFYVLEISSFQLDGIQTFKPDVAVLLNITPDHLDRYNYELKNYVHSKFKIVQNQTEEDSFIYCKDDPITSEYIKQYSISSTAIPFSMEEQLEEGGYAINDQLIINIKKKF